MRYVLSCCAFMCLCDIRWESESTDFPRPTIYRADFHFPYVASSAREKQIKEGFKTIKPGMTPAIVKNILGEPDIIRPLYEAQIFKPRTIGSTYWYLLEMKAETISNDEKLVRISFDLTDRVTGVDHWGFSDESSHE